MTKPGGPDFSQWQLRTVALAKQVPKNDPNGTFTADGRLVRTADDSEMNPFCRRAVSQAVRFAQDTHGHSTVITMGPPSAQDIVREALGWGADEGVHLSDPALAGADCLVTAHALAASIRRMPTPDLIVVGRSSTDGDTSVVGPMVAELLGLPFVGPALFLGPDARTGSRRTLRARLQLDAAVEDVRIALPAVVSVAERSCTAAKVPPESWTHASRVRKISTADLGDGPWSLDSSPTRVRQIRPVASTRAVQILDDSSAENNVAAALELLRERDALVPAIGGGPEQGHMVSPREHGTTGTVLVPVGTDLGPGAQALLGEAACLAGRTRADVVAVAPHEHGPSLARYGATGLIAADTYEPGPLAAALSDQPLVRPWAVLGPATDWGRELLARLAARWNAGLICDAVSLELATSGGDIRIVGSKPCGTRHVANIDSCSTPQLLTVRTGALPLRLPRSQQDVTTVGTLVVGEEPQVHRIAYTADDDYDALDRAPVVIGVGRGVQPSEYHRLQALTAVLDAELAATRAVTDAGWQPHARQVGVTARNIAPRLYVAIGLSGSPLHMAGVGRAGHILAINTDPDAEVFAHSDIGIVGDWRDIVPVLTQGLERQTTTRLALAPVPTGTATRHT